MAFEYPDAPGIRRHGPRGYLRYESYKPWLRDEFLFRCAYCLCRELWFPDGADSFSADHVRPRSAAPERATEYDNLVYACCSCNSSKQDHDLGLDPLGEPLGTHLEVSADGTIRGLTPRGVELIQVCRLDRPKLTEYRRRLQELLQVLSGRASPEAAALFRQYLGFPPDLPRLAALRPLGGNTRPEGIAASWLERRQRGELPEVY